MILITGGAGYIGSHCAVEFVKNCNSEIVIFDNLSTGHIEIIETLQKLSNKIHFVQGDLKKRSEIKALFEKYKIDFVVHFAAYSDVKESMENPTKYHENNVFGTFNLLSEMVKNKVFKIIFSSTAAIYGEAKEFPILETSALNPINPYGVSKLMVEKMLDNFEGAYGLKSIKLRYFNVIGANFEEKIGEWHDNENHLIPCILKSVKNNEVFKINGNRYETPDGTCIRDYVDVQDVAVAHRLAYEYLNKENKSDIFNLGSCGYSVSEVLEAVSRVLNKKIETKIASKREGDVARLTANATKAQQILGWKPEKTLEESIKSANLWEEYRLLI